MAKVRSSFDFTATGVLGDHRPSMLKNELHQRVKSIGHFGDCMTFRFKNFSTF